LKTPPKTASPTTTEVKGGEDGIAVANSKKAPKFELTLQDLYLALAKDVPAGEGKTQPNPNKTWKDVRADLPAVKIEVLGPPPTSGTRDAFAELAMEGGCKTVHWIKAMKKTDKKAYKTLCHTIREDGAYIEAGENDNLIVQKLEANPDALGIFGYSFLDQNADKVQGSSINGNHRVRRLPGFARAVLLRQERARRQSHRHQRIRRRINLRQSLGQRRLLG